MFSRSVQYGYECKIKFLRSNICNQSDRILYKNCSIIQEEQVLPCQDTPVSSAGTGGINRPGQRCQTAAPLPLGLGSGRPIPAINHCAQGRRPSCPPLVPALPRTIFMKCLHSYMFSKTEVIHSNICSLFWGFFKSCIKLGLLCKCVKIKCSFFSSG